MKTRLTLATLMVWLAAALPAAAHDNSGMAGGLTSGLLHPVSGLDHLIAMVAVGLWGAQLGGRLRWLLPVVFPAVMAVGGALGARGMPLPGVETGIALSAVLLGGAVALAARPPVGLAVALTGAFAILHGHAHGAELPAAASPLGYGIGFVVATGLLHLTGIAVGTMHGWSPAGSRIVRGVGAAILLLGGFFLVSSLGG
jgi:urease accessory protein